MAFSTVVSVAGVALGVAALVVVMGVLDGLERFITESVSAWTLVAGTPREPVWCPTTLPSCSPEGTAGGGISGAVHPGEAMPGSPSRN